MSFDRFGGDTELAGQFAAGVSVDQEVQHFAFTSQHVDAQFIGQLLERLVTSEPNHPFFVGSQPTNPEPQLARNFYLLQIAEVREKILDVLLHAHLRYAKLRHSCHPDIIQARSIRFYA